MATPSLFRASESMLARLHSLRSDSPRQWGKMEAGEMLAHCQVALRVALGDLKLKRGLIGLLFGRLAKKKLMKPGVFGRNMPTAPEFRVGPGKDFEKEKQTLLGLVKRFGEGGPAGVTKEEHPFFGPMTAEEWDTLQWKHLDHHLRQFGV